MRAPAIAAGRRTATGAATRMDGDARIGNELIVVEGVRRLRRDHGAVGPLPTST